MDILRRAVAWTFLICVGLVPLGACGKDGEAEAGEGAMAKGTGTRGSLIPLPPPRPGEDDDVTPPTPLTGVKPGIYEPTKIEPPSTADRPTEDRSISRQKVAIQANGTEIVGTLTRPIADERRLLVVMLHGYTGDRAEVRIAATGEGLFERAARRFAEAGIPSFRFDFAGSGQSGGAWRDTTFSGQAGDTRAVLSYLRSQGGFANTPIALLGFSQGGLVALEVAGAGARVARVALWNPVLDPKTTYSKILGAQQVRTGWQLAQAGETGTLVGSTRLAAGFFADLGTADPFADAAAYGGPLLIVSGSRDTVAASGPNLAEQVRKGRGGPTKVVVLSADHGFDATRGTGRIDKAIGSTLDFLLAGAGG